MSKHKVKEKLFKNRTNYHQWMIDTFDVFALNNVGHVIKKNLPYDPTDHDWKPGNPEDSSTPKESPGVPCEQESSPITDTRSYKQMTS